MNDVYDINEEARKLIKSLLDSETALPSPVLQLKIGALLVEVLCVIADKLDDIARKLGSR